MKRSEGATTAGLVLIVVGQMLAFLVPHVWAAVAGGVLVLVGLVALVRGVSRLTRLVDWMAEQQGVTFTR